MIRCLEMPSDPEARQGLVGHDGVATQSDPLEGLVVWLLRTGDRLGMTPVLVTSRKLSLTDGFYVALCQRLVAASARRVRLDLLPGHSLGWIAGDRTWPWGLSALNHASRRRSVSRMMRRLPPHSSIVPTLALSRPGGPLRDVVVGLAGPSDDLPTYAQAIELDAH